MTDYSFHGLGAALVEQTADETHARFLRELDNLLSKYVIATYDDPLARGSKEFEAAVQLMGKAFKDISLEYAKNKVYNKLYTEFMEVVNNDTR